MSRSPLALAALPLALTFAYPLHAAAAQDAPEIVVTASRFDEPGRDLPVNVTTIDAEDIARSTATTLPELLGQQGGLIVRNAAGSPNQQIDLRGFGMTGDQNTLILLDGQRISENELVSARLAAIPLAAIERIEILRGSGSVLYGGGATGGTINIITRKAVADAPRGSVALAAGSHGRLDGQVHLAVGSEQVGLSLSASRHDADNYRANNAVVEDALAGDLRYRLAAGEVFLKFGSDRQNLRLPGARNEGELASDRRGTAKPDDFSRDEGWNAMLGGRWQATEQVELAAEVGRRDRATNAFFTGFAPERDTRLTSAAPRLRAQGDLFGVRHQFVIGGEHQQWDIASRDNFGGDTVLDQRQRALFVQDSVQLAPGTRLTVGGRSEKVDVSLDDRAFGSGVPQTLSRRVHAHEIGVHQRLDDAWAAFAKTGRSFRIATLDENLFQSDLLEPQTSRDHELGAEWHSAGHSARATVFRNELRNEIHFNRLAGFFGANVNLPPTRRQGVELEAASQLGATLYGRVSYTRLQATFRSGVFNGVDVAGNDVPLVPRHLLTLRGDWQPTGKTLASLTLRYVGEQRYDNDQANTFRTMPTYWVADARISHDLGDWRLALTANNLFARKYYSYAIRSTPTSSTFSAYPEAERTVLASAEYRFR